MAYSAWSVIAGEQPTTAKWNILGTNDASFNAGTGFGSNVIPLSAMATGSVDAPQLTTTAITLGYVESATNMSTAAGNPGIQFTGLTLTVTIPSGGRNVHIEAYCSDVTPAGSGAGMAIWDGVVGSGTQKCWTRATTTNIQTFYTARTLTGVGAGSKTYNVGFFAVGAGSATTSQSTGNGPAYLKVTLE